MENTKEHIKTKRSIRFKIMTITVVILMGIMLISSGILRYSMQHLTESILLDILQPMAGQSARTVESDLHLMADRMSELALDKRLTDPQSSQEDYTEVLKEARSTYEFYGIALYSIHGNIITADGQTYGTNLKDTTLLSLMQKTDNLTIADPLIADTYVGLPMGIPVRSEGETWGYLVGTYKYDMLSDVLGAIHIGQNGMALLMNEKGKVVGHPSVDIVREEVNIYDLDTSASAHSIFDRMLSRETGTAQGFINGQDAYVAFCPVRGTRWSFAVEVPKTEYMVSTNLALLNTLVGTFGTLIVALILIWATTTMISAQLKKAILRVNGLAQGDLTSHIEVKKTGDEVEILSSSLESTVMSINEYILEIQRVLDNISQGNLNVTADGEYRGDFHILKESLTQIITSMNNMMKQISHTALRLTDTAQSMSTQSEELQQAALTQTNAMDDLNSKVEDIQGNLNDVTLNTKETKQRTDEIAEQIANGNRKMQELKNAMEAIAHNAADISKISNLMEDIAQQTTILALNASVEAQRVGEAGKGFSIVASEVRMLAGQSSEAAKHTVEIIETTSQLIRKGVKLTTETSQALEEIHKGSHAVTTISNQLSETVDIQEESLREMSQRIEDLSSITRQNLQCAKSTATVSLELDTESKKLKELLDNFQFH
ncbi:MAG: methyl-accepting chemotaxis protein [Roseburia sp.]|nr:methyl-accepting chemotaxis protein [Roseburia sp.]